jgi:hypothetical protein
MNEQEKGGGHITAAMGEREQVEATADRLRDELLLTLEELERRRERALDVKYQLQQALHQNRELLFKVGGAVLVLVGLSAGYSAWRSRRREELLWKRRGGALRRAWEHPERLASTAEERPLGIELGRKLVVIFATALASAMAKNAVRTLVPVRSASRPGATAPSHALRALRAPAHA